MPNVFVSTFARYVALKLIRTLVAFVGWVSILLIITGLATLVAQNLDIRISLSDVLTAALLTLPQVLTKASAIAIAASCVFVFARLDKSEVLVTLRSSGMGALRISIVPIALSVCLAVLHVCVIFVVEPMSVSAMNMKKEEWLRKSIVHLVVPGQMVKLGSDTTVYVEKAMYSKNNIEMKSLVLTQARTNRSYFVLFAQRADMDMTNGSIELDNGFMTQIAQKDSMKARFDRASFQAITSLNDGSGKSFVGVPHQELTYALLGPVLVVLIMWQMLSSLDPRLHEKRVARAVCAAVLCLFITFGLKFLSVRDWTFVVMLYTFLIGVLVYGTIRIARC